jgi:hypothetical protein
VDNIGTKQIDVLALVKKQAIAKIILELFVISKHRCNKV